MFSCGDGAFLIVVGVAGTLAMQLVHRLGWHFALSLLVGMVAAMIIQSLLAMAVAPILGSIESMVPSMLVAMLMPMTVCAFDMIGLELTTLRIVALGSGGGFAGFLLLTAYGCRCRKALCCPVPQK